MSRFTKAVQKVAKQGGVTIKIGDESFDWKMTGASLEMARQEGLDPFKVFQEMEQNAQDADLTLSLSSIYVFLWMGLAPHHDVTLEDVQQLPMQLLKQLPMQEMMTSMSGNSETDIKKGKA